MNLNDMNRRVDRLLASVELREVRPFRAGIRMHLFTEQEHGLLLALLEHIEPRISTDRGLDLSGLTDGELDELEQWLILEQALAQEDRIAAARSRVYLTHSRDELLAAFLTIDEQQIITRDSEVPTYTDRHGRCHELNQAWFGSLKQVVEQAQGESLNRSTIGCIRMWVETFVPAFGR